MEADTILHSDRLNEPPAPPITDAEMPASQAPVSQEDQLLKDAQARIAEFMASTARPAGRSMGRDLRLDPNVQLR